MSTKRDPLVTCTACGREVIGFPCHGPVADSRGIFHAADCPSLKEEKPPARDGEVAKVAVSYELHSAVCDALTKANLERDKEKARADSWVESVTNAVVSVAFECGALTPREVAEDYYRGNSSKAMRDLEFYARKCISTSLPAARGVVSEGMRRFVLECVNGRIDLTKNSLFAWSKSDRPEAKERILGIEKEVAKQESMRAALSAALSQGGGGEAECEWMNEEASEDGHSWGTGCGHVFYLDDGEPKENGMNFCPFCGEKLKRVFHEEGSASDR